MKGKSKRGRPTKDYYYGDNAEEYSRSRWMAKNQIKTSLKSFELLNSEKLGGPLKEHFQDLLILDLGCGSGFSTIVFEEKGFNVIGLDISFDMLLKNLTQQGLINEIIEEQELIKKENEYNFQVNENTIIRILINAPIEYIPLRKNTIDHIISISSFNFILNEFMSPNEKMKIIEKVKQILHRILKSKARVVIEFYPELQDINIYLKGFKDLFEGGLIIENPKTRKEQKFLILKKF